ncbi:hypothetical protein HPB51_003798 [Rhipicephalus microplus]|uniref:PiggyBac transposable element-derived protein domain-containing protein n=1 Tax=Rhipicephalus microplus TaxID=6941 RepID=A0A9J6EEX1_RHIMP|nr:hypothetical protein HPB51_003798 [Rhipicephalus microplus]
MGIMHLPQVQLYWFRGTRKPSVLDHMTRNRFYELRNHLHFVDTSATTARQKGDKLHLVRPIVDCFQAACRALPRSTELLIDEQMTPFSGRCGFRQYLPSKPNPLGLKNSVLASPDGPVLDFVVYTGKNTVDADDSKLYGLGRAVVKKLATTITDDRAHTFTDRYFTGLQIMDHLLERTVFLTGTVNANRTKGAAANLPSDKAMKRGDGACLVRDDGEVCVVKWKDNKSVLLMSSAVGCDPVATCMLWCKEEGSCSPASYCWSLQQVHGWSGLGRPICAVLSDKHQNKKVDGLGGLHQGNGHLRGAKKDSSVAQARSLDTQPLTLHKANERQVPVSRQLQPGPNVIPAMPLDSEQQLPWPSYREYFSVLKTAAPNITVLCSICRKEYSTSKTSSPNLWKHL